MVMKSSREGRLKVFRVEVELEPNSLQFAVNTLTNSSVEAFNRVLRLKRRNGIAGEKGSHR